MLTTSGAVYTMGCGEQGQLGRLAQRSASRDARQGFSALLVPSKVTLKLGASRIWAGYHATFALDANSDKMFAWGLNNYGQLGITGEKRRRALYSPMECDAFTAWRDSKGDSVTWRSVAAGQHHSLALDGAGSVLALGRCEYGRLGLPQPEDAQHLTIIPALQHRNVVSISASTSSSFAVTAEGEVYSWGMGSEGQLGTGACADAAEPVAVPHGDRPTIQVSAGGQHTVLLVEDTSSTKEPSPAPDQEMAEQTTEDENTEEEEVKAKRPKNEQEGEISSTSSAHASEVAEESKPQKVNGDETDTPMEVDDTGSF
ncbi:hypothetical protein O3G_MSEX014755 [Manduca sexta]|uniref:RCC1-like domain-containing protein n=1 Tax=Manduca sexta TaxID=7130 RepID=A0A921ZVD2_MANSE|nr:hypothetical protein O3G_MSEX014755 [Manduca sexta]